MRPWIAEKDVAELFFEAQRRHCPYGWVMPIDEVGRNPQLEARDWWTDYRLGEATARGPGAPYRFSATPWRMGPYDGPGAATEAVLAEIGWEDES